MVVTGTEVVEGRVREANAGPICRDLADLGVRVEVVVTVGDGIDDLVGALRAVLDRGAGLVVTTGGLGPTHDDRTMEAVARVAGRPLALDPAALAMVEERTRGFVSRTSAETMRDTREKQSTLPAGARVLPPPGTAPGAVLEVAGSVVVVLPGPPWECRAMWADALQDPAVRAVVGAAVSDRRVLRFARVVESEFVQALGAVPEADRAAAEVGVCARPGELEVTVRPAPGAGPGGARAVEGALEAAFGDALFSRDGREVDDVVAEALRAAGQRLAVAESCTGGGLGARITAAPGSSDYFLGGVIAYDNRVKTGLLGVPEHVLARDGAVSEACARAMAAGVRERVGADWALSVTGVAGPGGGTPDKPVGLVWLGIAGPGVDGARELRLRGDRAMVRSRSATEALHLLREHLAARA